MKPIKPLSSTAFQGMCNMRFLKLCCADILPFPDGLQYLSDKLSYLEWPKYPLESFPRYFHPENLVELDLTSSKVKYLWDRTWPLSKLKVIKLNYCSDLIKIPDLSEAPNLEHMDLFGCASLLEVKTTIQYLSKLMVLNLGCCQKLTSLPSTINLKSLRQLGLSYSYLEELPDSLGNLSSLGELNLENCPNLKELPDSLGNLSSLRSLNLSKTNIVSLPASIKHLSKLTHLVLRDCKRLQSLPELPSCLTCIRAENCISLQTISISSIRVIGAEQDLPIRMEFKYYNCLKLDPNSRSNIEAYAQLKIQRVAATYRNENDDIEDIELMAGPAFHFACPGSEIPGWFNYRSTGVLVTIQLPWDNSKFLGVALCAIVTSEVVESCWVDCNMGTRNGVYRCLSSYYLCKIESEHMFVWYESCSRLGEVFEDEWYRNNKTRFQFLADGGRVEKCGVHLLYEIEDV